MGRGPPARRRLGPGDPGSGHARLGDSARAPLMGWLDALGDASATRLPLAAGPRGAADPHHAGESRRAGPRRDPDRLALDRRDALLAGADPAGDPRPPPP